MDIEIEGQDGSLFHVHGRLAGAEGVALGEKPEGMIDVPVVTRWVQTADGEGATLNGVKFEPTDLELVFHTRDTEHAGVEEVDSRFRRAFDYVNPAVVRVTTSMSGTRELAVTLRESPRKSDRFDMHHTRYTQTVLALRAGKPFWTGRPEVYPVQASGASGTAMVTIWNPTDRPVYPRWVLQPGARWTVPDFDFAGDNRVITMPASYSSHEVSINTAWDQEMIRIPGWPNAQEAMGGVLFDNHVPPHTDPTQVPVSWTGASGSPVAAVLLDRQWTRPWGME